MNDDNETTPKRGALDQLLTMYHRLMMRGDGPVIQLSPFYFDDGHWRTDVQVLIGGQVVADGEGRTAEEAAEKALARLRERAAQFPDV